MMQINPSQLSNAQAAMGVGGSQMGPPTGMTAPGRMGGAVGPVNPTGQWMNRKGASLRVSCAVCRVPCVGGPFARILTTLVYAGIGASGPQRPARYQQDPTDILTKQKLQELIRQVAPNDRLEPEVEEVPPQRLSLFFSSLLSCWHVALTRLPNVVCSQLLQDIAEDFVESVTTFACSLAKLRKVPTAAAAVAASSFAFTWGHVATRVCVFTSPSHPRPTSRIAWTPRTLPSTWNETGIFKYRVAFPLLVLACPVRSCVLTPFVSASGYSPELDVMSVASGSPTLTQSTVASLKRPLPEGHKQRLALVKKTMALQRKREEKEREKERKQREDQKERGKQQQQQLQAHQQAEKQQQQQQQQQRTEASGELEKKATTPDLKAEVKKEKSEAAAAAAGDEATTEKNEKKDNVEVAEAEDEEEAGDEVKKKKQKTLQEPAEAKRDGEASEKEAGGDMQTE